MKRFIFTGIIILFVMAGCGGDHSSTDGLITVDVNDSYSTKKELVLQDFMDVEYIPLETNDDFVNQGFVQAIGKEFILVKNYRHDGDIFVYDRTGKAIRKINRKGQGGEEYISCRSVTLDEENNEKVNKRLSEQLDHLRHRHHRVRLYADGAEQDDSGRHHQPLPEGAAHPDLRLHRHGGFAEPDGRHLRRTVAGARGLHERRRVLRHHHVRLAAERLPDGK